MEAYVETNDYENIMMTLATISPGLMIKIMASESDMSEIKHINYWK